MEREIDDMCHVYCCGSYHEPLLGVRNMSKADDLRRDQRTTRKTRDYSHPRTTLADRPDFQGTRDIWIGTKK
jgi:hypothetical protein